MAIEVIVGLPHLRRGPLLERAREMRVPVLVSANSLSRWKNRDGWRQCVGWNYPMLDNAKCLESIDLDSAGFVATSLYGNYPWPARGYMDLAASYPFRRFASLDYCVEPEIAGDREAVRDRIARTIGANRDCRLQAEDLGIADRLMPVLQGRVPHHYEYCAERLWHSMTPGRVVGVGSMCRRPVNGPEGLIAVVEHLDRILPAGLMLHIFGAKGTALPYLAAFESRVASIDSQAYGIAARRDAYRRDVSKSDDLVAEHMTRWTQVQRARATEKAGPIQQLLPLAPAEQPPDERWGDARWAWAMARAREQIRDLIEAGEMDYRSISERWLFDWACDLYRDGDDEDEEDPC